VISRSKFHPREQGRSNSSARSFTIIHHNKLCYNQQDWCKIYSFRPPFPNNYPSYPLPVWPFPFRLTRISRKRRFFPTISVVKSLTKSCLQMDWFWLTIFRTNIVRGPWNKEMKFQNKGAVLVQIAPLFISQPHSQNQSIEMWIITCLDPVSANSEKCIGSQWAVRVGHRLPSRFGQSGAAR
jgi:hypothetical protein